MVNGQKIESKYLTSCHINNAFGSHEYSIAGEYDASHDLNEIQIIMKAENARGIIEEIIIMKPCSSVALYSEFQNSLRCNHNKSD